MPIQASDLHSPARLLHVIYLRYAYYGSLTAMNTIFAYPWISVIIGIVESPAFRNQVALSTDVVAQAARNIILTARYIDINVNSPQWLAFYYPMVGLINLFTFVLKFPSLPSARSDVALMDVIVGHFGHMEVITFSEISFPFVREVASLAYNMVKKTEDRTAASNTEAPTLGETNALMSSTDFHMQNEVSFPISRLDVDCRDAM